MTVAAAAIKNYNFVSNIRTTMDNLQVTTLKHYKKCD